MAAVDGESAASGRPRAWNRPGPTAPMNYYCEESGMATVNGKYQWGQDSESFVQQCRGNWNRDAALRAEFGEFERYLAYEKNKDNVKILSGGGVTTG